MSLETLLEAAKYVEYRSEAKARGEEPIDYHTFSKLCTTSHDGLFHPVEQVEQKRQTVSTSHNSPEDIKEKKRSNTTLTKEGSHEHSGTGTREVHNKLEKNRRAHLKECFELLKKQLPNMDDRKTSNLSILRNAIRFIQTLKRKERDYEHEMERLAREKISFQQRLSTLKKELASHLDYIDVNNFIIPEDDNDSTTTASECGVMSDSNDTELQDTSALNSATTSDFASSSSSSTASSVLVGPISSTASSLAFTKPVISGAQISVPNKESVTSPNHYVHETRMVTENKATLLSSVPAPVSVQITTADNGGSAQAAARLFSTGNLHTMTGIFAAPHGMQVISQPSGIKVITTPNSIMTSNSSVQHISVNHHQHGQIHVLTPSSNASYASSIASTKPFSADSLVQMAGGAKGIPKPHLVPPLALVSQQTMVELNHGNSGNSNSTNLSELITSSGISNTLNLSQNTVKGNSVLSGNMAIAVKNNLTNVSTSSQSNMITALHVSKPHSQVIQPSLASSIITQGSQVNNGTHHGATTGLKPIASNHVRSLPHIAGIAHVVSQSPISAPVGQIVTPGSHVSAVTPLVGSVSVVSHTGAVHQQSLGKVLASPVLKSVNQMNTIPIIQQQFLQQVSVGSSNQPIVKPVVVVSMPNVVPSGNISPLTPTSLVAMNEQSGVVRGSVTQK
ncbi:max-binding protein MNT [Nephila pilipes]|uniref:Max-binding protein MNT n=1 Tax=Nephila pilipes TaxID=299642 RepID=A0A8X6TKE4_NEPPI|nr:max-binding protein MNT [Nephila pilipes]